jgi:hypothetical protein
LRLGVFALKDQEHERKGAKTQRRKELKYHSQLLTRILLKPYHIALMALPEDIVTRVRQDFGEDDGLLVLHELKSLQSEDAQLFGDRILRCIVAWAKGSMTKFDQIVAATRLDPRDVMVAAEGWGCNALLMNYPFPVQLDEALCRRWLIGQKIRLPWSKQEDAPWKIEASDIRELELRRVQRDDPAEGDAPGAEVFQVAIRMLCARGQWISSSPAFEIWLAVWYQIDLGEKAFTLRRMKYNPNEIKQRGKWV